MSPIAKTALALAGLAGLGGVALALRGRDRGASGTDLVSGRQIFDDLRLGADDNAYESRVGTTKVIFPAPSWENARAAGMTFTQVLAHVQPNAWALLNEVAQRLGLSEIYVTSLFRATGTGPHTSGRGVDLGYVRRGSDPLVLLRRVDAEPATEPALARELRVALREGGATQVLTPWWIYSKGTRDDPNTGAEGIDADHLSHLHITLEALA